MDIPVALTSIGQAISIAKTLSEINKDFDASTFRIQIADLTSRLADAKLALVDAQDDLRAKDAEIARLKATFQLREQLVEDGGFKLKTNAEGKPDGYAICPRCEVVDARIIHLARGTNLISNCPECKRTYDLRETTRFHR